MNIVYKVNHKVAPAQFLELLQKSTLGERRPVDDLECITGMIENSNLVVTAWDGEQLVGISRSVTDFHFACYLSDLAVHKEYQRLGIGTKLQVLTQEQLGPKCSLILLAAPAAHDYYGQIGYETHSRCWVLPRDKSLT